MHRRLLLKPAGPFRYGQSSTMIDPVSSSANTRTVLIVEDNDIYRQVICAALQRQFPAWEFLPAASLAEARSFIGTKKLDIAVTDLSLPDGSGVDLLPSLATQIQGGLKLVALTNDSSGEVLGGLKRRGYHGFVAKEHGLRALCEALQTVAAGQNFVSEPPSG
jgi:DNA-binding NarL/FixJ family response regulator